MRITSLRRGFRLRQAASADRSGFAEASGSAKATPDKSADQVRLWQGFAGQDAGQDAGQAGGQA
jgi:hypothetical protein